MLVKVVIVVMLLVILYSLASAFVFMVRDKGEGERVLRRLMWRVGLSIFLLALIYLMFQMGWIEHTAVPMQPGGGG